MGKFLFSIFTLLLCVCLQAQCLGTLFSGFNDIDEHISHYAHINQTHHDNIDDEIHVHTHKHTEDGEEHEHDHEHHKGTNHEVQLVSSREYLMAKPFKSLNKINFPEKNLFSDSYPSELFRPPIV